MFVRKKFHHFNNKSIKKKKKKKSKMKRSIGKTVSGQAGQTKAEFVAKEMAYGKCGKTLEVPYAFGKLNVVEMVDPETNVPTGLFNVLEAERGFSFGIMRLSHEEKQADMDCMNERFLKLNTATTAAAAAAMETSSRATMLQQKKENDYLPATRAKVPRIDLSLPRETSLALQWGSLGFYCQGQLLYTHCLWGDAPLRIGASTLKDVLVAARFVGGHGTRESLAEDFRTVLAKGFTLTRNSHRQTVSDYSTC